MRSCQAPIIIIFTSTSYYKHKYAAIYALTLHLHTKKTSFTLFTKTYPGYIPFSTIISGWNTVPSTTPGVWGTTPSESCHNCKPERTKAMECTIIIPKRTAARLIENDGPTKSNKLEKGK